MPQLDKSLLAAALTGYQQQLAEIDAKIAQIKKALGGRSATPGGGDAPGPFLKLRRRGRMSAAARKRLLPRRRDGQLIGRRKEGDAPVHHQVRGSWHGIEPATL